MKNSNGNFEGEMWTYDFVCFVQRNGQCLNHYVIEEENPGKDDNLALCELNQKYYDKFEKVPGTYGRVRAVLIIQRFCRTLAILKNISEFFELDNHGKKSIEVVEFDYRNREFSNGINASITDEPIWEIDQSFWMRNKDLDPKYRYLACSICLPCYEYFISRKTGQIPYLLIREIIKNNTKNNTDKYSEKISKLDPFHTKKQTIKEMRQIYGPVKEFITRFTNQINIYDKLVPIMGVTNLQIEQIARDLVKLQESGEDFLALLANNIVSKVSELLGKRVGKGLDFLKIVLKDLGVGYEERERRVKIIDEESCKDYAGNLHVEQREFLACAVQKYIIDVCTKLGEKQTILLIAYLSSENIITEISQNEQLIETYEKIQS